MKDKEGDKHRVSAGGKEGEWEKKPKQERSVGRDKKDSLDGRMQQRGGRGKRKASLRSAIC